MPAGRWSVFQGILNNHAESKEKGRNGYCFVLSHAFKVPFFPTVCLVVGRGCKGDYEFCQADQS